MVSALDFRSGGPIMIERTKQAKVAVGVMNIMNTLRDF